MSEIDAPAAPEAGWYADPAGTAGLRLWDGAQWTDQTRDYPPTAVPAAPPEPEVVPEPTYVPMTSHTSFAAAVRAEAGLVSQAHPLNRAATIGRNFGLMAVLFFVVDVVLIDLGTHVPGFLWAIIAGIFVSFGATILAVVAIIVSSVGLARIRYHGQGGVAAAGLVLGIVFTGSILWTGIAEGIIAAFMAA